MAGYPDICYLKQAPWTRSIGITWDLLEMWSPRDTHPKPAESEITFSQDLQMAHMHIKV